MADDEKDNWIERNSRTITTLATVSIPIVLAVFGFIANMQISEQQLNQEYVDLAIGILGEETNVNETDTCKTEVELVIAGMVPKYKENTSKVADAVGNSAQLRKLPKTLYRKWALDLLLESTPKDVRLTTAQYNGLLCGERLAAATEPEDANPTENNDEAETESDSALFGQLESSADEEEDGRCLIVSSDTDTVGVGTIGEDDYRVTESAEITADEAGTETVFRYVKVTWNSSDADQSAWVLVGPTAQVQECSTATTTTTTTTADN